MIYFLLPNVNTAIYKYIDCLFSPNPPDITISNSLSHYLFEIKNKIKQYENNWNEYKKYTNPYEFINTIIPGKNRCVAKYKPLSRSYFKMIEIIHFLVKLDEDDYVWEDRRTGSFEDESEIQKNGGYQNRHIDLTQKSPICTFHLAEGPGGFIEAIVNMRNNPLDKYYGMTIMDDVENCKIYSLPKVEEKGMNVPGWKKTESFLRSHPNILLEYGVDGTGNILSIENFMYCRNKYGSSMDFITADGGFDFSIDFNNQEMNMASLLFAQICYAFCLQKQGGCFILKIFDCFMDHTVDILYILSSFYEKVYITKPQTSRYANSEKYIVCKNFLFENDNDIFPYLKNAFQKMSLGLDSSALFSQSQKVSSRIKSHIYRFLKIPVSLHYIYRLEEYNSIFGQQQIENIYQTIILIEHTSNQRIREDETRMLARDRDRRCEASEILKNEGFGNEGLSKKNCNQKWHKIREVSGDIGRDTGEQIPEELGIVLQNHNTTPEISSSTILLGTRRGSDASHLRTIANIRHPKTDNLLRTNIQKCIQWCIKHNISYASLDSVLEMSRR